MVARAAPESEDQYVCTSPSVTRDWSTGPALTVEAAAASPFPLPAPPHPFTTNPLPLPADLRGEGRLGDMGENRTSAETRRYSSSKFQSVSFPGVSLSLGLKKKNPSDAIT